MTKAEEDFIEQYTRVLLVQWCTQTIAAGVISDAADAGTHKVRLPVAEICLAHAIEKGWVGKAESKKVLAKGFAVAAAFLKR